ncbi:MAG: peptidylprolyl isomerase [Alphaproteobacteria bacterium]|nr:peptidylprolyl isomerase [Alphaproteobacteria bacterium]
MKRLIASAFLLVSLTAPAWAQHAAIADNIAAVVNDNVITTVDLGQRLKLALLSSGLPDTPDVRAHILPQILRAMIDEQLKVQEAKRLDLSVSDDEINAALASIAQGNHIEGGMRAFIAAHGGSPSALVTQVRDEILWSKVVQRELRPRVEVGDDEVDAVVDRIRANAGATEYLVSEIFLPIDSAKDEDQVKQAAENLSQQLRRGANFAAVARQFSQGPSAAEGGDIGWIQQGQLSPELNRALAEAQPGQISDPIRAANGYYILGVRDRRVLTAGGGDRVTLTQAFMPYGKGGKDEAAREADALRAKVRSCAALDETVKKSFPLWNAHALGTVDLDKVPPDLAGKVEDVPVNGASQPIATDKGEVVLFVCARDKNGGIDREAILRSIGTEKLQLQARGLLRDLRRNAYIDIRLGS